MYVSDDALHAYYTTDQTAFQQSHVDGHTPNSLGYSNVSPKLNTTEGQGVGAHSLTRSTIEG
jgi:hypothetical protein